MNMENLFKFKEDHAAFIEKHGDLSIEKLNNWLTDVKLSASGCLHVITAPNYSEQQIDDAIFQLHEKHNFKIFLEIVIAIKEREKWQQHGKPY